MNHLFVCIHHAFKFWRENIEYLISGRIVGLNTNSTTFSMVFITYKLLLIVVLRVMCYSGHGITRHQSVCQSDGLVSTSVADTFLD